MNSRHYMFNSSNIYVNPFKIRLSKLLVTRFYPPPTISAKNAQLIYILLIPSIKKADLQINEGRLSVC